jgi:hypothetical protein
MQVCNRMSLIARQNLSRVYRWNVEGTSNRLPRLSSTSNRNSQNVSDIYMHDADYLRINNLTLGYNFKEAFLKLNLCPT